MYIILTIPLRVALSDILTLCRNAGEYRCETEQLENHRRHPELRLKQQHHTFSLTQTRAPLPTLGLFIVALSPTGRFFLVLEAVDHRSILACLTLFATRTRRMRFANKTRNNCNQARHQPLLGQDNKHHIFHSNLMLRWPYSISCIVPSFRVGNLDLLTRYFTHLPSHRDASHLQSVEEKLIYSCPNISKNILNVLTRPFSICHAI